MLYLLFKYSMLLVPHLLFLSNHHSLRNLKFGFVFEYYISSPSVLQHVENIACADAKPIIAHLASI